MKTLSTMMVAAVMAGLFMAPIAAFASEEDAPLQVAGNYPNCSQWSNGGGDCDGTTGAHMCSTNDKPSKDVCQACQHKKWTTVDTSKCNNKAAVAGVSHTH